MTPSSVTKSTTTHEGLSERTAVAPETEKDNTINTEQDAGNGHRNSKNNPSVAKGRTPTGRISESRATLAARARHGQHRQQRISTSAPAPPSNTRKEHQRQEPRKAAKKVTWGRTGTTATEKRTATAHRSKKGAATAARRATAQQHSCCSSLVCCC